MQFLVWDAKSGSFPLLICQLLQRKRFTCGQLCMFICDYKTAQSEVGRQPDKSLLELLRSTILYGN